MVLVWVALRDVFPYHIHALERAGHGRVQHIGKAQAGLRVERDTPFGLETLAGGVVGDEAVAAKYMGPATQAATPLHIDLAAQRVYPHAFAPQHATGQGQVAQAHHPG